MQSVEPSELRQFIPSVESTAIGEDRTADAFKHLRLIHTIQSRDIKDTGEQETAEPPCF